MLLAAAFCIAAGAMTADADAAENRKVSLDQPFDDERQSYTATVPHDVTEVTLNVAAAHPKARVTVNGGDPDEPVQLAVGKNTIVIVVTAEDERYTRTYTVTVTREGEAPATVAVTLSATPNPVGEGSAVTVTATLAKALAEAVTIPLTVTRGTSEDGDHGSLASIRLPAGFTSATGTITTVEDSDGDDETFTVALGTLPSGLAAGGASSVEVTITDSGAQQQTLEPLTAAFENVPSEHDGTAFTFDLTLSEAPGAGKQPVAASFKVAPGKASVSGSGTRYTVTVTPKAANAWKDVTVTLAGGRACDAAGAVCTADGRALSNRVSATVGGPVRIRIEGAKAREGKDESLDFAVTLNRAAAHEVSVDYATEDGTAAAGADYTATSGTLVFAAGETAKTVKVPLLDDAIDEGKETMRLLLSNPKGAFLRGVHRKAKGVISNQDPLPKAWLGRFGRAAASDAVAAVTARLETPRDAGSHLTLAGQRLSGDGAALAHAVTGLARAFGAEEAGSAPARSMSGRELLMGTSFRMVLGQGAGSRFTGWGQGASVSRFSGAGPGLSLSGETATGVMGMDYGSGRLLTGLAMTHSLGEGKADGSGRSYAMGSSVTTVLPYARYEFTERVSAWSLVGTGSGRLTLERSGGAPERYGTDLSMTLAAAGVRSEILTAQDASGFTLALKADAFWVRTESDAVSAPGVGNLAAARADATRLRAVLDGSRTFRFSGGGLLTPSVELGFRHDGGEAESGTGMELSAGMGYADLARGLDMALRVHGLLGHAEEGYREWGVSGQLRLVPGVSGRGFSVSVTPSYGADPGGSERLWTMPDASGLAAKNDAAPSSRLDTEVGYGLGGPAGLGVVTPYAGLGLANGGSRAWRAGARWQVASGFTLGLEGTRKESGGKPDEHGVMVRGAVRW